MYHETDEDGEPIRLGAISEVAEELGVPINQVSMWAFRHERNGFPDPVGFRKSTRNGVMAAHYDIDAVRVWRLFYVPAGGGYPAHKTRRSLA